MKVFVVLTWLVALAAAELAEPANKGIFSFRTTADRISAHGYPVEEHSVETRDGYILQMFRIPFSPKLQNNNVQHKPVIFLLHGLTSSSDCWILNGPENALAFLLADAGYDVWLGNARGNTYSKKHFFISPLRPSFWQFEWNEIGIYDLPAMLDYVLTYTKEDGLHYVGHSQGSTAFMVLLSTIPLYSGKIKTSHMLGPVGFMNNMASPLAKVAAPLVSKPSLLGELIGGSEFMPNNKFLSLLGAKACRDNSIFQPICANVLFLMAGWDSKHLNYTLLPEVMETHPAGASSLQIVHYMQEYDSGKFRMFDFGLLRNRKKYGQLEPSSYMLENIRTSEPIQFYYSDNDNFASVIDVERLAKILNTNAELNHVEYLKWNHLDFLWALNVKEAINDRIIAKANHYESIRGRCPVC